MSQKAKFIFFAIIFLIVTGTLLLQFGRFGSKFTDQQDQNKAILDKAISDKNPGLCYQIKGSAPYPKYDAQDKPLGLQLIDQKTAIRYCTQNALTGRYFGP